MAEAGSDDCEIQKKEIDGLIKSPLKKNDTWYLVDAKWFKQWKKYVGFDSWDTSLIGDESANPGPIDNSPLIKEDSSNILKEHLMDEIDYMLVPEEAWEKLVSWYGLPEGGAVFARKVIEQGMFVKQCKVEVYLMDLKLCQNSDMEVFETRQFSRADTIEGIEKVMQELFSIDTSKEVRLWNKYMSNTYEQLSGEGKDSGRKNTVQDAGLYQGQVIVIEQKNSDGTWPRQTPSSSSKMSYGSGAGAGAGSGSGSSSLDFSSYRSSPSSSSSYYGSSYDNNYRGSGASPGLCGLSNLGNTCFMNSAIQCLSNVPQLTQYMLDDSWSRELNRDNPLGMHGEIATTYAELIKNMWSGKYSYTVPRNFKVAVGRFQPQFSGYQQQDSQELMAFLLDGLHEDLNRIKKKPYVEIKDGSGRKDDEVAKEAWINYRKRNDSIIVDTFHGLLKSTLVCPQCEKVSVTFDPFCYLSLPLPLSKKERQIEVFFVPMDAMEKLKQYKLTVPKMGSVGDLCSSLAKLTGVTADKMVVTDVYNHRFHKFFPNEENLSHILDRDDIFIYEVPVGLDDATTLLLPVYMREQKSKQSYGSYNNGSTTLFGLPLLVPVNRKNCTMSQLYQAILARMKRYVSVPGEDDKWWLANSRASSEEKEVNGEVEMKEENSMSDSDSPTDSSSSGMDVISDSAKSNAATKQLFSFQFVNSYGSTEVDTIHDDSKPIKFPGRPYLAIDWHPQAKHQFYDEKAAEECDSHESVNSVRAATKKQQIQLTECLDLFTTTEKLGEQDPWYCPQCKDHRQATKKFDLWSLPNILVIHLKRFSYNRYWRDKLDTLVEYPVKGLCMKKWLINNNQGPATYDLLSVSNHYGGLGGGHYTAYGVNKDDGQWYHFDDSSVSSTAEDSVVTKAGYVLVYQRRNQLSGADSSTQYNNHKNVTSSAAGAAGNPDTNGSDSCDNAMDVN